MTAKTFSFADDREPLRPTYHVLTLALPIIATDPNKGPTSGLLPVAVVSESERITNIFAPDVTYNEIDGVGAIFRMRRSFSRDASLDIDAGTSSEGNDDYDVIYRQRRIGPNEFLYYRARFHYRTDLSQRFYGLGHDTVEDDESSFVLRKTLGEATLGLELPLDLVIEFKERVVSYKVGPGRLDNVPSTRTVYPEVRGVRDRRTPILTHQIRLAYDSRDSLTAPTEGVFAEFTYEVSDSTLGSDVGFHRFGLAFVALIPKWKKRFTTAVQLRAMMMIGNKIPFYELSVVGGKDTQRGYGFGRFRDKNGYALNLEERIRLTEFTLAGNDLVLQLAGFVDIGRVYADGEPFTLAESKVAGGGAVRLIVPASELVTSIDVGVSNEGPAVFVGLGYPF